MSWFTDYAHRQKQPPELFYRKRDSKNFTGKHLCQGLFFKEVAGLRLQLY